MCKHVFYSSSTTTKGGNAGVAAAYSARALGVPIIVIVPSSTAQMMQDKMRALGADVRVFGAVWDEANIEAIRLSAEPGCVYIPPFDHVRLP